MLIHLQKQLDEQWAEATCEDEEAALERDVSNHIQNHLLVQLETLQRS